MTSWTINTTAVTPTWTQSNAGEGAFQANAFQDDAFQTVSDSTSWTQNTSAVSPTWVVQSSGG
jgi:hypothetical protein